jgi:hypothetical protein
MRELEETHSSLVRQRKQMDERIHKGDVMSAAEERRLIEIDEAIEALESAIEFENDEIVDHENRLRDSVLFKNGTPTAMNDVSWFFDDTLLLKLSFVTSIYII